MTDQPKKRGGLRNPAGGRPRKEEKKVKINITIDADLLDWIDAQGKPRSQTINAILRAASSSNDPE